MNKIIIMYFLTRQELYNIFHYRVAEILIRLTITNVKNHKTHEIMSNKVSQKLLLKYSRILEHFSKSSVGHTLISNNCSITVLNIIESKERVRMLKGFFSMLFCNNDIHKEEKITSYYRMSKFLFFSLLPCSVSNVIA